MDCTEQNRKQVSSQYCSAAGSAALHPGGAIPRLSRRGVSSLALLWAVLAPASGAFAAGPVAELTPGGYVGLGRVILIFVAMLPWLLFCQWLDQDLATRMRKFNREMWNGIVLGGGIVGLFIWLFLPWKTPGLFAAGFGLWFVVTVGACGSYVFMRNGTVGPDNRVFTPTHIKAWFAGLGGKKKKDSGPSLAFERVKITGADKKKVTVPQNDDELAGYEAAQNLLFDALWRRATDVEMLLAGDQARLVHRIDGVATPRHELLTREAAEQAMIFLKRVAGLVVEEKRKPQKGTISGVILGGTGGDSKIEVTTSGTTQQERLALKIVGDENRLRIADLGLTQKQRETFDGFVGTSGGLILVSGPRGSGITSTLYAALRCHDAFMQNILTIEQSLMMDLENITQHTYDSTKHEGSYARQLQTVLRREPDVVMISDCMDRETAHLAVTAARSGKRIYMGVQAKDSFDALKRVLSLAGDTDAVAEALLGVTSQRLLRKLCVACRIAYKPDPNVLKKANLPTDKIEYFYRMPRAEECVDEKGNPRVCPNCQGSGHFGRTGIFEVLAMNDAIREQIRAGQPVNAIRATARKSGMLYLQEIGVQKVIEGVTSMAEMLRVIRDEEAKPGQ